VADHVRYVGLGRQLLCLFPERTAVFVMQVRSGVKQQQK
jgi:hypothetical protein